MYSIGIFEIFIVFLVLLLFFHPREIFRLFRRAGGWYNRLRNIEKELKKGWDLDSDTDNPDGDKEEDKSL